MPFGKNCKTAAEWSQDVLKPCQVLCQQFAHENPLQEEEPADV